MKPTREPLPPKRIQSISTLSTNKKKRKEIQDFSHKSVHTNLDDGSSIELNTKNRQKYTPRGKKERNVESFIERDSSGNVINREKKRKTIKYRK